jgi:hypothetical protein
MRKTDQARVTSNDAPLTKVRIRLLALRSFADAAYSSGQKISIESSGGTTAMSSLSRSPVRGRQIDDADIGSLAELLGNGFPGKSREYWSKVFNRLARHSIPAGRPKYGYLIESEGAPVGVILLISSAIQQGDTFAMRCNLSTWYVQPNFRFYAPLLISQATAEKSITYLNITPAGHTRPILEAQGFSQYSHGRFVACLYRSTKTLTVANVVGSDVCPSAYFEPFERDLLLDHARYGCVSVWCTTSERAYPFVFLRRFVKRIVPCVQLIYCRHIDDLIRFARPIGRYLGLHGYPLVLIDSEGPIRGLVGKYVDGTAPKYFKGPTSPRLGDLAYTETAILPGLYV